MARSERYVGLLRAVNVGGRNRVPMADLRSAMAGAGYADVSTYLQSGNVVWTGSPGTPRDLAAALGDLLRTEFGVEAPALVIAAAELRRIADTNPFVALGADPATLHVTLMDRVPDPSKVASLAVPATEDEFAVVGSAAYLRCRSGYGQTPFPNAWWERRCSTVATTRNWRTILAVVALAGG